MKCKKGMELPNQLWFWLLVAALTIVIVLGFAAVAEGGLDVKNIFKTIGI